MVPTNAFHPILRKYQPTRMRSALTKANPLIEPMAKMLPATAEVYPTIFQYSPSCANGDREADG